LSRAKGDIAEKKAREYLVQKGHRVVETNYYSRYGEIDIITIINKTLHFVEVKSGENFDPLQNITPKKISNIIATAEVFMKSKKLNLSYCIDVVTISGDDINIYENVTI
jgi:putative endonuclease